MKRRTVALILAFCLSLSGCSSLLSGEKYWEQPHHIPSFPDSNQELTASNYQELLQVLSASIEQGLEQFTISAAQYDQDILQQDINRAMQDVRLTNPVASFAVTDMICQIGTSAGESVLVVKASYLFDQNVINSIPRVADNEAARQAISESLNRCDGYLVLRIDSYDEEDFLLFVEQYAFLNPQYVMEMPRVTVNLYPESGKDRVLEMRFQYTSGRDSLQVMQEQVLTLFESSVNIVSVAETPRKKFTQMYSLLVERFPKYTIETSITPAYSLLLHGVGDARAFATIYAAMCREAGLDCMVVAGTKAGKLSYWNIVLVDGTYYHVDLLRSKSEGNLRMMTDSIIEEGYVWDFDAYPACGIKEK